MDAKIIKAIIEVRKKVTKLETDSFNEHGRYKYVSIDTYYQKIVPLASDAGLVWRTREAAWELFDHNNKSYVKASYAFDLYVDGAEWKDYMSATVSAPLTGPQTTGQMFSYADKVFMRVAFGVATGEADGDSVQPSEGARRPLPTGIPSTPTRVERFEDGDVPKGVDPLTGEVLPTDADALVLSKTRDGYPLLDTRKVDDKSVEMVVGIFRTWLPKVNSYPKLLDFHAENVAAIEKIAKIDPVAKETIKGMFSERRAQLEAKEKKS